MSFCADAAQVLANDVSRLDEGGGRMASPDVTGRFIPICFPFYHVVVVVGL